MSVSLTLQGAQVLRPGGLVGAPVTVAEGKIQDGLTERRVDLRGYWVLPGIVDAHGDSFERHVAPRRGAMKDIQEGICAAEAEMAAQGVTTAMIAQFYSWEGGIRSPEFADKLFCGLLDVRNELVSDLYAQLRFETHMVDDFAVLPGLIDKWQVKYVVFNDHLPHKRLAAGRKPAGLTGKALGAGTSPEKYLAYMNALHARGSEMRQKIPELIVALKQRGVLLGSHDDADEEDRSWWHGLGVRLSEFPETAEAAQAAREKGDGVILGCPNIVRGGSHKGNASALDLVAMGLCDGLASDYHYPSMRRAAFLISDAGLAGLEHAWALISAGPARLLGFSDRGVLEPGYRADLVVLDPHSRRICATMSGGRFSYMNGDVATRLTE